LLFSLVIADTDGKHQQMIWNIYYHFYLDESSLEILSNHARRLVSLSTSIDAWHRTTYGRILRFCDLSTFTRVTALWRSYCVQDLNESRRSTFNRLLEANLERAKEAKAYYVGSENVHVNTGIRSAAPVGLAYAENAHVSYQHYWKFGSTSHDPLMLTKTTLPNPLFAFHSIGAPTLHYGTDPLLGFHLATAFAPMKDTPPASGGSTKSPLVHVVEVAQFQFRAWCHAFRLSSQTDLTIRFFTGDAMAFAHALYHVEMSGDNQSTNVYRDVHHLSPIELDEKEYNRTCTAPLMFNVIDTSNLGDHVGALNLLTATSPLLRSDLSSTLYTESLVRREKDHREYIDSLLCGDFATMSLLLDLFPIEYWTNASSSSTADNVTLDNVFRLIGSGDGGQMRVKLTWKRSGSRPNAKWGMIERTLRFNETDLAHILHKVYRNMFQHEDILSLFKDLDKLKIERSSTLHYHRGSFVVFLRLLRSRVSVADWHDLMNRTLGMIENDSTITMGRNYIQELYLYLHTLNLYTVPVFTRTQYVENPAAGGIARWKDLPEIVCLTLQVPRKILSALTGPKSTEIGTPIGHCIVQSSSTSTVGRWQNIFSGIQIAFGTISIVGKIHTNDFKIQVAEDDLRWQGKSPLVVSFKTPSWFLLLEPQTAIIAFGLQSTPLTCTKFAHLFGPELNIFQTVLGNEEHVYVSRHQPNLTGTAFAHNSSKAEHKSTEVAPQEFKTTFSASVVQSEGRITTLSGRMDLLSDRLKHSLRSGCAVKNTQIAPCDLAIGWTNEDAQHLMLFPVPVCGNKSKTRIARKSSYIEVEAPLYGDVWTSFPAFSSSHTRDETANVHRIDMRTLPALDETRHSQLQWLSPHVAGMLSGRERRLREESMSAASASRPDARVSFKDSLFSLFMHYTGLQGRKTHVFGLDNPDGGGVHILIFVSSMRLDLGSQTVVLDTAVLPLTRSLVPRIGRFLSAITQKGFCSIKVDGEELKLWRQTLPLFAERCRVWHHHPTCDHVAGLEHRTEHDINDVLCACGRGSLPEDFVVDVPNWTDIAGLVTGAAISPIYSVPMVDPPFDGSLTSNPAQRGCTTCGKGEIDGGGQLLKCSVCRTTKYCSLSCQKSDWKSHKRICQR
jgi:hypothetical protein